MDVIDVMDDVDGAATASETEAPEEAGTPRARLHARRKDIAKVRYVGTGFLLGIPARDLTVDEWVALTDEQRDAAIHSKSFVIVREGE